MPRIRRTPASTVKRSTAVPQEPVIIPYDAPIPPDDRAQNWAAVEQSSQPPKRLRGLRWPYETTLSDALLENLNGAFKWWVLKAGFAGFFHYPETSLV